MKATYLNRSLLFATSLVLLGSSVLVSAATEVVPIGDFVPGFQFNDNWADVYANPGQNWKFSNGAADRIGKESTGGNPDGFASNGHLSTDANSLYGVFVVDSSDLTGSATFSFDILNNSAEALTYQYSVWYADESASGSPGGFGSLAGENMPYGGSANTRIINGEKTVSALTGWNESAVGETIVLSSVDFSNNNVGGIAGWSDVNRIIIGIQFNNHVAGIDGDGGIDNVSFLVAVPEPSSFALIAGLMGLASVVIRRRR